MARDRPQNVDLGQIYELINDLRKDYRNFKDEVNTKAEKNAKELSKIHDKINHIVTYINNNTKSVNILNDKIKNSIKINKFFI